MTWEFGGDVTWLEVRLAPTAGGGTRLELEHAAPPNPQWDQSGFGPGAVGIGWDLTLLALARHLTPGAEMEPAEAEAWQSTDEGHTFMRQSSDAGCLIFVKPGMNGVARHATG